MKINGKENAYKISHLPQILNPPNTKDHTKMENRTLSLEAYRA